MNKKYQLKNISFKIIISIVFFALTITKLNASPGNNPPVTTSLSGNAGFENGTTDWTFSNAPSYSSSTTGKRSGSNSLKLSTNSTSYLTASFSGQATTAPIGATYVTVIAWYKSSATIGTVNVGIYNSSTSTLTAGGSPVVTTTTLTAISASFAVTSGQNYYPVLYGKSNSGTTSIYYDDVVFYFSNISAPDLTVPLPPSHIMASTSGTEITLTWDAGSDAETSIDGYLILRQAVLSTTNNTNPLAQCNYSSTSSLIGPTVIGAWDVVYNGGVTNTFVDDPGATGIYTYLIYTRDNGYNYNAGSTSARILVFNGTNLSGSTTTIKLDGLYLPATDTLTVASGTVTIRAGADIKIDGIIKEQGNITNTAGGSVEFRSGSMYHFNRNGSATAIISPVTWSPGSLCKIDAITTIAPSGLDQTFANLTWNCTAQNVNVTFPTSGFQVNGTFSIQSTGATAKNITLSNSIFNGDVLLTGGTLNCASSSTITLSGSERQIFCITGSVDTLVLNNNANAIIGNNLTINSQLKLNSGTLFDSTFAVTLANNALVTKSGGNLGEIPTFAGVTDLTYTTNVTTGNEVPSGNVRNLTLNTSGTVILNSALTITGALTLTSGILETSNANLLTLSSTATVAGATNSNYVDGPVKKIGNTAFTFPIGDNGNYKPLSITAPAVITDAFTATYLKNNPSSLYDTSLKASPVHHVSLAEYWTLDESSGTSPVQITLAFDANSGGINNLSDLIVAHWYGGQWISEGNAATTGTTSSGTVQSNSVSTFSPFTIGSKNSNNPLPIELIQFNGECKEKSIQLNWSTASEHNNNYFEIERSNDNENFKTISHINGGTNSNTIRRYEYEDKNPTVGITYYRLKQTDYDGKFSYFHPIVLNCSAFEEKAQTLSFNSADKELIGLMNEEGKYLISIYEITGRKLSEKWLQLEKGLNRINLKDLKISSCTIITVTNSTNSIYLKTLLPPTM